MRIHTDKTINFSTKPICPKCGCEIPADEVVVEKDHAWCPNCRREMSFAEVADYSLVQAKRNKPLPPGFSIISDSEDSLVISFKSARIGLRLFGLLSSILLAIPIPWVIYHMAAGHSRSYLVAGVALVALMALEIWILLCLRNEWKLHSRVSVNSFWIEIHLLVWRKDGFISIRPAALQKIWFFLSRCQENICFVSIPFCSTSSMVLERARLRLRPPIQGGNPRS